MSSLQSAMPFSLTKPLPLISSPNLSITIPKQLITPSAFKFTSLFSSPLPKVQGWGCSSTIPKCTTDDYPKPPASEDEIDCKAWQILLAARFVWAEYIYVLGNNKMSFEIYMKLIKLLKDPIYPPLVESKVFYGGKAHLGPPLVDFIKGLEGVTVLVVSMEKIPQDYAFVFQNPNSKVAWLQIYDKWSGEEEK